MRWCVSCLIITLVGGETAWPQEVHRNSSQASRRNSSKGRTMFARGESSRAHRRTVALATDIRANSRRPGLERTSPTSRITTIPTPVAPLTDELTAELFVHSNKAGVELLARIVFPQYPQSEAAR